MVQFNPDTGEATAERTIGQSGNSKVVRLPPELLDIVALDKDDDVEVTARDGEIVISPIESAHK